LFKASEHGQETHHTILHSSSAPADFAKELVKDEESNGIAKAEVLSVQKNAAIANGNDGDLTEVKLSATLGEWRQLQGVKEI